MKTYTAGRRFDALMYLSLFLNECAVFLFYFIYRYVFRSTGIHLVILFVAVGLLIGWLTLHYGRQMKANTCYRVTDEALIVKSAGAEKRYPWKSFTQARVKELNIFERYPVYFVAGGERLELSQTLDDIYGLGWEMLQRMPAEAVSDRFRTMTEAHYGSGR